jgi:menaquinone-specific isochorismate synthase
MALKALIRKVIASDQLELAGSSVFLRNDKQIIGTGSAIQITARGKNRVAELAAGWKEILATAEIDNQSGISSAGLIALTSITFSENSSQDSVLYVPMVTRVHRGDVGFEVIIEGAEALPKDLQPVLGSFQEGSFSAEAFKAAVGKSLEAFSTTDLEKVVIGRDLLMPIDSRPNLAIPLKRLHERYPDCWTYAVGDVFGASPELLLRAQNGEVSARVLAGTAGRGTDPDVDRAIAEGLAHSQKNRHEHEFAVSSMVQALEPFCEFVQADSEPFSLALPDLWHLATDVKGELRDGVTLLDAIAKLHPTAAVAGTPTRLAEDLIDDLEPFDRAGYAGPVGWLSSNGDGELAIALRGGIIEPNQIRAIAGCGIVTESDPEAELAETDLKFKAVRYAFAAESL